MQEFEVKVESRVLSRMIHAGTQRDPIRALLELIINSDDSYRRLEEEGRTHEGRIEILYTKDGSRGVFGVRDSAEGMSYESLTAAFSSYGAATSGSRDGKQVTGFFGTGAKNSLAGMSEGKIISFKDGFCTEVSLVWRDEKLWAEFDGPHVAGNQKRWDYGVPGDGTMARFVADPDKGVRVPRFDTVHQDIANHWRLRKIMSSTKRTVLLKNTDDGAVRRLHYSMPKGQELLREEFEVPCDGSASVHVRASFSRADSELQQEGDDRRGGLLVLDEKGAILDMSLFKFDREPLAKRLFGEVILGGFRKLMEREEPVLDEKREGLNRSHPVCRAVIAALETRIDKLVQEELRRQTEARSRIDEGERARYRNAMKVLNDIAQVEAEEVEHLGSDPNKEVEPPPNGLSLYPDSAHVSLNKRYGFEVRIDTTKFGPGSLVRMSVSNTKLIVLGNNEFRVGRSDRNDVARRWVTVYGTEVGIQATLKAEIGKNAAEALVCVDPAKEESQWLFNNGMVFRPETVTVRMNRTRTVLLRVYVKIVEGGSTIKLASDNASVHVWPEEIMINEADADRHVAEYKVQVWGDEPDVTSLVTAAAGSAEAGLEVQTRLEAEQERPRGQGMFSNEPYFDTDENEPLERISYSRETGSITIYTHFPSVQHYLGKDLCFKKTLAAQVFMAEMIAERCFLEMARARNRDAALSPEAAQEKTRRDALELSRKYGARVHKALVDPDLMASDRSARPEPKPG